MVDIWVKTPLLVNGVYECPQMNVWKNGLLQGHPVSLDALRVVNKRYQINFHDKINNQPS